MRYTRTRLIIVATLSILVSLVSYRFLLLDIDMAFPDFGDHISARRFAFIAHITASPIALLIGGVQFFPKMRAKRPNLHRWLGRIYGVAILVGGISGLVLAVNANGGAIAGMGFGLLSIVWTLVTAQGIRLAMAGKIVEHQKWMIRSFALTFAAVTLRVYLPIFMASGFTYAAATVYIAWLCWVPNLIFAEWWIRRRGR